MNRLLSFILLAAGLAGATDPPATVQYPNDIRPANIVPTFDNGYLVAYGLGPQVAVYGRDGSPAFRYAPPANASVHNVAVDTDGWAAAALEFHDGRVPDRGGIGIVDRTGAPVLTIELEEYVPYGVAFAPDHSVWSIGGRMLLSNAAAPDYEMLRHYSREGRELGRYLPRSSIAATDSAHQIVGISMLRIAGGRVGAYLHHREPKDALWVETTLDGKEIGRWSANLNGFPSALTADREVYAQTVSGVMMLDRASGQWKATAISGPGPLIGSDGRDLVFLVRTGNSVARIPAH